MRYLGLLRHVIEKDQSQIQGEVKEMLFTTLAGVMLAIGPNAVAMESKQRDLSCPAEYGPYCGGWFVTRFQMLEDSEHGAEDDHLKKGHRFVIGKKGQKVSLFPRNELAEEDRWGRIINLNPKGGLKPEGYVRCLVGMVNVARGHPGGGNHMLLIEVDEETLETEIGPERYLRMYIFDPPLDPQDPCKPPPDDVNRHAGEAHAED